ncbi:MULTISPECIES: hypothetical protein [unclassified Paraburkholderia]|uniref:hypothetical protein n=1 Tax=unclassified Paraburkholderia TaxID=2615204 RepID=UPI001981FDE3|nr:MULTISPECIES: hypothetical protein [unclassified Paraburkholderia]MBN3854607.1 hypothetical protein [Paraburkholderia sp. Ac-20340]
MDTMLPDYLIREQAAVLALVVFGLTRIIAAALACTRGWRIAVLEQSFIGVAVLWCAPQLIELIAHPSSVVALAELEGKAIGCAMALFFSPILSHRLGYE